MYAVVRLSRKWRLPVEYFYYPRTEEGLRRARAKRSELLARYLDNDVELHVMNDDKAG